MRVLRLAGTGSWRLKHHGLAGAQMELYSISWGKEHICAVSCWRDKSGSNTLQCHTFKVDRLSRSARMQSEWNKYVLKHKFRGVHGGEQSWNHSKQQERTMPPEVDGLEISPSQWPNQAEEWGEGQVSTVKETRTRQGLNKGVWPRETRRWDYRNTW